MITNHKCDHYNFVQQYLILTHGLSREVKF